ncbi:hypothetical protein CMO90_02345 [Candidatus Woesearchaeota archaeon]|jgi:predicted metal-dependent hydrolase|nr:hypothetical protein [Candidatus Woesearchaeota archaeon]|tara:strand:- start:28 stop:678 length:651 start_codon:yes stop_codon:yes gene_type:complete
MKLVEQAIKELFPEKNYLTKLYYSKRFKDYNANIRYNHETVKFSLSKKWKDVSDEIQIGLMQTLLLKVFKQQKTTINIDLYNGFIKQLPKYSVVNNVSKSLKESFDRVNKIYFNYFMETPNLKWGKESFRKIGSYEYHSNTITISSILKKENLLLDYVMYHEMLHKKLSFKTKNNRNFHHTSEFRKLECKYKEKDVEKKLEKFLKKKKLLRTIRIF